MCTIYANISCSGPWKGKRPARPHLFKKTCSVCWEVWYFPSDDMWKNPLFFNALLFNRTELQKKGGVSKEFRAHNSKKHIIHLDIFHFLTHSPQGNVTVTIECSWWLEASHLLGQSQHPKRNLLYSNEDLMNFLMLTSIFTYCYHPSRGFLHLQCPVTAHGQRPPATARVAKLATSFRGFRIRSMPPKLGATAPWNRKKKLRCEPKTGRCNVSPVLSGKKT